jgi:hypothetical protein
LKQSVVTDHPALSRHAHRDLNNMVGDLFAGGYSAAASVGLRRAATVVLAGETHIIEHVHAVVVRQKAAKMFSGHL